MYFPMEKKVHQFYHASAKNRHKTGESDIQKYIRTHMYYITGWVQFQGKKYPKGCIVVRISS